MGVFQQNIYYFVLETLISSTIEKCYFENISEVLLSSLLAAGTPPAPPGP